MKLNKNILIGVGGLAIGSALTLLMTNSDVNNNSVSKPATVLSDKEKPVITGEESYLERTSLKFEDVELEEDCYYAKGGIDTIFDIEVSNYKDIGESIHFNIYNLNDVTKREIELALTSMGGNVSDATYVINILEHEIGNIKAMVTRNAGYSVSDVNYMLNDLIKRNNTCVNASFSVLGEDNSNLAVGLTINTAYNTKKSSYLLKSGLSFETVWSGYRMYDTKNNFNIIQEVDPKSFSLSIIDKNITNPAFQKQLKLVAKQFKGSEEKLKSTFKRIAIELKSYDDFKWDDTGSYSILNEAKVGDCIVSAHAYDEDYDGQPSIYIMISEKQKKG